MTPTILETMKQALEILRYSVIGTPEEKKTITNLRAAIKQYENAEPYGFVSEDGSFSRSKTTLLRKGWREKQLTKVYKAPTKSFGNSEQVNPVVWMEEENVIMREDFAALLGFDGAIVGTGRAIQNSWKPILFTHPAPAVPMPHKDAKNLAEAHAILTDAAPTPPTNTECKCDMRTKLAGDGCSVCNPEYAKDHDDKDSELREYLKDGETPLDRIKRYHAEVIGLMGRLAEAKTKHEELRAAAQAVVENYDGYSIDRLRKALK